MKKTSDRRTSSSLSRRALLGSGAAAGAVAATAAVGAVAAPKIVKAQSGDPIIIGTAAALTGWGAADGLDFKQGCELAIEDINAMGGIAGRPVEFVVEDCKEMGPQNNIAATRALIDRHGVHAICNGYLVGSGAEYDIIADAEVMHLNCNTYETTAKIVRDDPERYYTIFSDSTEIWYGTGLLVFLKNLMESGQWEPSNRKVALITSNNPYSVLIAETIRDYAQEYGWEVSLYEEVVQPIAEWGPTLAKIRSDPPGLIANTHFFPQDIAQFALQFAENPTPSLVYMQYGPSIPEFINLAKETADGILWATVVGSLAGGFGLNFQQRYTERYGENAGFRNAGQTYDLVMMYAQAASRSGNPDDPKAVANVLRKATIHRGVCGSWKFEADDQCARPYPGFTTDPSLGLTHHFYQIQGGQQVAVGPAPYIQGEFQLPSWL
ncbi:MAG: ABC transporter substrate-binding protein [Rhodospirillaceae bacterium]|nr:ABC transporter substrate-binding protein [Rhodospirillaceae bacterium]